MGPHTTRLHSMDIQVDPKNFQHAYIFASRAEHTFAYLLRHRILEYKGPLGTVKSCGIKQVDEDSETSTLELEIRWDTKPQSEADARRQFAAFMQGTVKHLKSRLSALAFQVDKQADLLTATAG
jgi:hypothetical protein